MEFEAERLWLHYIWIFIVEFGTIIIYGHVFFHLRKSLRSIIHNEGTSRLSRATRFMILYPVAYILLTLPIAVGRMVAMSGAALPELFFVVAGSLLTSCGWVDALLYALTRRVVVGGDFSSHHYGRSHHYSRNITAITTNAARPGDGEFGLQSINKEAAIDGTGRTVTIVGGAGNRLSRIVDQRGRKLQRSKGGMSDTLRERSLTGSQDSIVKPTPQGIEIVTETNIRVETMGDSDSDSRETMVNPLDKRKGSEAGFSAQSAKSDRSDLKHYS